MFYCKFYFSDRCCSQKTIMLWFSSAFFSFSSVSVDYELLWICWQVGTKRVVYLFDVLLLGGQAFKNGLGMILENPHILKVRGLFRVRRSVAEELRSYWLFWLLRWCMTAAALPDAWEPSSESTSATSLTRRWRSPSLILQRYTPEPGHRPQDEVHCSCFKKFNSAERVSVSQNEQLIPPKF